MRQYCKLPVAETIPSSLILEVSEYKILQYSMTQTTSVIAGPAVNSSYEVNASSAVNTSRAVNELIEKISNINKLSLS